LQKTKYIAFLLAGCLSFAAQAFTPEPAMKTAPQEATAQQLFHALRCVVCEGQSLAESDATLARQMRSEVRRMVRDGKSEADILFFFQARYGDTILMSPPVERHTYLLWSAPLLFLLIGVVLLLRRKA
jgi:cytochrome c-type biogenesis protein CcmH